MESLSSNRNLCPNSIVDYCPIRIPTKNPNRRSQFQYKINLFSIKIDQMWLNSIYFWLKDWFGLTKCQLFNRKRQLINRKLQFISKIITFLMISTNFRYKSTNFRYKSNPDSKSKFTSSRRFRWISETISFLKTSIKADSNTI